MELLNLPPADMINRKNRSRYFFDAKGAPLLMCKKDSKGRKKKPGTRSLAQTLNCTDTLFIDFLSKCLCWRQEERMNPYEAMNHPWLSKQQRNEPREYQSVQHFTVKELNTGRICKKILILNLIKLSLIFIFAGDILSKFKAQTEKFNLVNRSAVRFSSLIRTKNTTEDF